MQTTFVKKNPESGMLHAYRDTGSHFERRCGVRGIDNTIYSRSNITEVSDTWFFEQTNACNTCKNTFDDPPQTDTSSRNVAALQEIARELTE